MTQKTSVDYSWTSQREAAKCETIQCREHDPYKDFKRDPSGYYVLVRTEWDLLKIAVAVCNKQHEIVKIFKGHRAPDIYTTILEYEKKHKQDWFKEKSHVAYLGKELKKAEIAMAIGVENYFQE